MITDIKPDDRILDLVLNEIKEKYGSEEGVTESAKVLQKLVQELVFCSDYIAAMNCADHIYGMMKKPAEPYVDISESDPAEELLEAAERIIYCMAADKAVTGYITEVGNDAGKASLETAFHEVSEADSVRDVLDGISKTFKSFAEDRGEDKKITASYLLGAYYVCCRETAALGEKAGNLMTLYVFRHPDDPDLLLWQGACVTLQELKDAWAEEKRPKVLDAIFTYGRAARALDEKYGDVADGEIKGATTAAASYARTCIALFQTAGSVCLYFEQP